MGQKVNPIANRLGIIRGWDSNWFGGKDFSDKLVEDAKIRKYLNVRLAKASISKIIIERTLKLVTVTISTARPGIIIGKGGQEVDKLKDDHITRKWNGKIITQTFLTQLGSQMKTIAPSQFFVGNLAKIIARVEHLEQEFVAFLSILTHQGLESLHCRSFNLLESIKRIYLANGIKDIVALRHFYRAEISRPLGYCGLIVIHCNIGIYLMLLFIC